jgi:quercetin dioxygenase-like cupin family protein
MKRTSFIVAGCAIAFVALGMLISRQVNAQEGVVRNVILKQALEADPTKEVTMFIAEYKPGASTGKHYHPGQEFIYVIEGHGSMQEVGKPAVEMNPGVSIYFRSDPKSPAYVHEGVNLSKTEGMKLLVVLITEKGQPLAYPVMDHAAMGK